MKPSLDILNIGRKFDTDSQRRDYFRISGINKYSKQFEYNMSDNQMTELENSIIRKIIKKVMHSMQWKGS